MGQYTVTETAEIEPRNSNEYQLYFLFFFFFLLTEVLWPSQLIRVMLSQFPFTWTHAFIVPDKAFFPQPKSIAIFLISPQKHRLWVLTRTSNEYPQHMFLWINKKNIYLDTLLIWSSAVLLAMTVHSGHILRIYIHNTAGFQHIIILLLKSKYEYFRKLSNSLILMVQNGNTTYCNNSYVLGQTNLSKQCRPRSDKF